MLTPTLDRPHGSIETAADEDLCPVAKTAAVIGSKWTLLIIRDLAQGKKRFNELEKSLGGISAKTLSERLRGLEHGGIINRRAYAEIPPRVEYDLTEKGQALLLLIDNMRAYGERWL